MHVLPFGKIKSRLPTAVIISFIDFREEMILLMRRLSHKTRAYLFNAGSLRGFLEDEPIRSVITRPDFQEAV